MARVTVEDCLVNVKNRFELILVASKRARDIMLTGAEIKVPWNNDKPTVVALREIAQGDVTAAILDDTIVETVEPEIIFEIPQAENEDRSPQVSSKDELFVVASNDDSAPIMPSETFIPVIEESDKKEDSE